MPIDTALTYAKENESRFVDRWFDLLRIETISAQREHNGDCRLAAEWLAAAFSAMNVSADILETAGHPAVVADTGGSDDAFTVLVYGHYDVQPVGDLALWDSPPFEPAIRDGRAYARGACDDKGQMLTHVFAAEAWQRGAGEVPVRLKFLIEGEEETGSPNLADLVRTHADRLACNVVAISDTSKFDSVTPGVTYGTKGLVYKEIFITGPKKDLHSGSFGGTVVNPANALATIIATLRTPNGRVTIPGFYDDVRDLEGPERDAIAKLPFNESEYLAELGSPSLEGEVGFTTLERRWARPTLDVNGIFGGYMGEGAATIVPARAGAKISMRLVPDQASAAVSRAFDEAVQAACPPGVTLNVVDHGICDAYAAPLDSPEIQAARRAVEQGFGKAPVFIREGGTLPILPLFKQVLGADSLLLGYADPNCNLHSPNEWLGMADFQAGIRSNVHLYRELAVG
jgi:acetylornithine deacetylase/succinyl-diaminopimelate desuccinylase-like protein